MTAEDGYKPQIWLSVHSGTVASLPCRPAMSWKNRTLRTSRLVLRARYSGPNHLPVSVVPKSKRSVQEPEIPCALIPDVVAQLLSVKACSLPPKVYFFD